MYVFIIFWGLVSSANSLDCLRIIATISATQQSYRSSADISTMKAFKNGDNDLPIKIDLSEACVNSCPLLRTEKIWTKGAGSEPTMYESQVMQLKKGDTVSFDGIEYRLGEFLGAGNSTHIFRLADHPGQIIRIPFVIPALLRNQTSAKERIKKIFSYSKQYADKMHEKKGLVPILKNDPRFRFMIAKEVQGHETGYDLLNRLLPHGDISAYNYLEYPTNFFSSNLTTTQKNQIESLLDLMEQNREIEFHTKGSVTFKSFNASITTQYMWDNIESRWYLIDVE